MEQDTAIQSVAHAKAQTHGMVCQWVAQSRDAKELTKGGSDEFSNAGNGTSSSRHLRKPHVDLPDSTVRRPRLE